MSVIVFKKGKPVAIVLNGELADNAIINAWARGDDENLRDEEWSTRRLNYRETRAVLSQIEREDAAIVGLLPVNLKLTPSQAKELHAVAHKRNQSIEELVQGEIDAFLAGDASMEI